MTNIKGEMGKRVFKYPTSVYKHINSKLNTQTCLYLKNSLAMLQKQKVCNIHFVKVILAGADLEPIEFTPSPLGSGDVTVRVLYCGLCYSDIHVIDSDVFFEFVMYLIVSSGFPPNIHLCQVMK